jgi:hypothetical protein
MDDAKVIPDNALVKRQIVPRLFVAMARELLGS